MNSHFVGKAPEVSLESYHFSCTTITILFFQQVANRFLSQLKDANPDNPFVQDHYKKEDEFERVAKLFTVS